MKSAGHADHSCMCMQTQLHESAAEADADDSEEDSEEDETILARLRHMLHLDQGLRAVCSCLRAPRF